jgi:hypothetical protein
LVEYGAGDLQHFGDKMDYDRRYRWSDNCADTTDCSHGDDQDGDARRCFGRRH